MATSPAIIAYLYMCAGAPLKTQAWLKEIMDTQYKPTPDGLVGNDDMGRCPHGSSSCHSVSVPWLRGRIGTSLAGR